MTPKNAQKLVGKLLPGYKVQTGKQGKPLAADAAPHRAVEVVSPSLSALKRRYFDASVWAAPKVVPDGDDSGIVLVEKKTSGSTKGSAPRAVIFSKGKIIGRQG